MAVGLTPIYRILKDGADISSNFNDRGISVEVEHANLDFGDRLTIMLDDRNDAIAFPEVGASLSVFLGYEEIGIAPMGTFRVEEVVLAGPPRTVGIVANSNGLATELSAPAIESFEGRTVGEIVRSLGQRAGLQADVHPIIANIPVPFVNQTTSAAHLFGEIARNFGGVFKVHDGRIIVAPRDAGRSVGDAVVPVFQIGLQHLARWEVRHNSRTQFSEVQASYFDPVDNVRKWISQGPAGSAFAGRVEGGVPFLMGQMFGSVQEAEAAAASKMSALVRGSATLVATMASGDPWIRDAQRLMVRGVRTGVDGSWVVSRVTHRFGDDGLTTTLEANVNGAGQDYGDGQAFGDEILIPQPGEVMGRLIIGSNGMAVGSV